MITLNTTTTPLPQSLNEFKELIQTDNRSLNGSRQRDRMGAKWAVDIEWKGLTPQEYSDIMAVLDSGNSFTYTNDFSTRVDPNGASLTFTALGYFDEGDYRKGASYKRDLKVKIREV